MRDGVPTIALEDAYVCPVILSAFHLLLSKKLKGLCWGWRAGAEGVAEGLLPWGPEIWSHPMSLYCVQLLPKVVNFIPFCVFGQHDDCGQLLWDLAGLVT